MSTPASPPARDLSPRQLAFGDLEHELASTRRVLERVPEEHFSWKPHEKSWSLGQLSLHLANLLFWQITVLRQDEFDLATTPPSAAAGPANGEELLRTWDDNVAALQQALASTDDTAFGQPWTLRRGAQVIMRQPRGAVLRGVGISHLIHHRGQLTVYLRLLNVPVPGLYGPSADEQLS
ncbi:MAG TPA: DinB family protein [Longimicrobiaceae bacterium]|nr:DinB family protein [Longimicrobiaceae bacterium]